jgi:vancomycin resistance protein YoaR
VSGPFVSSVSRRRHWLRRLLIATGVVVVLLGIPALALGGLWVVDRDAVPPRTTIAGVELSGSTREQAARELGRNLDRPIRLVGPNGVAFTSGATLGAEPLEDEALDSAFAVGLLERAARHLGLGGERTIELEYRLGPVRLAELANRLDARFSDPPTNADLVLDGTDVSVIPAAPGTAIDRKALKRALRTLPHEVGVSVIDATPAVTTAAADEARLRVGQLLDDPRAVAYKGVSATLFPKVLAGLIRTAPGDQELSISLDPEGLAAALRPRLGRFEKAARDAQFIPAGKRVHLRPSGAGEALDGERIGASLVKNLTSQTHLARFRSARPELTTAKAKTLGIKELISEFTTYHPCCASRVSNIHRAADIMDGTIVLPGETFSLNEVLGKRTVERGFLSAPQIYDGRLEDAIGGGVSQISTTTYNAAFFAGVRIVTHQPHQFYISRYPMGREATVSWGGPEMIWKNDWPAAILVDTSYTDTSITVRFYSSKLGRRVTTATGEPYGYVPAKTITISNSTLPRGSKNVVQSAGPAGFTVSYTRKVFRDGKLRRNERYTWRYDAENAIVEVGPPARAKPKPKPKPGNAVPPAEPAPASTPPPQS